MRRQASWHIFPILLVGLVVLSTRPLWAQETAPLENVPVRLSGHWVQLAPVPEARTHRGPVSDGLVIRASSQWLAPTPGTVHHPTTQPSNDLHSYVHHVPWAGPISVRVSQHAKAHPHVTAVLKVLRPQF